MTDEAATDPNYHVPPPRPQAPPLVQSLDLDDLFNADGTIKVAK